MAVTVFMIENFFHSIFNRKTNSNHNLFQSKAKVMHITHGNFTHFPGNGPPKLMASISNSIHSYLLFKKRILTEKCLKMNFVIIVFCLESPICIKDYFEDKNCTLSETIRFSMKILNVQLMN